MYQLAINFISCLYEISSKILLIQLGVIFSIALVYSLGHCIAMCGGIVLIYSQFKLYKVGFFKKFLGHLTYGLGRITSYIFIGCISAIFSRGFFITIYIRGIFYLFLGILMISLAVLMYFMPRLIPAVNVQSNGIFKQLFMFCIVRKSMFSLYSIGVLNGFLPCGIVYFFALTASSASTLLEAALVMLVFGLATLIPMVSFGLLQGILDSFFKSAKFRKAMLLVSCSGIAFFGIWTILRGVEFIMQ